MIISWQLRCVSVESLTGKLGDRLRNRFQNMIRFCERFFWWYDFPFICHSQWLQVEVNLLGSLRVTKLSLPLLKRWAVLFQGEQDKKVLIVHTPWKTIVLLFLSKEDLTRCVGGGRIINVTRWEEKLSRFWSKLSSALLDSMATRASRCTLPQSMRSRVLVTYETIF